MIRTRNYLWIQTAVVFMVVISSCARVPITGRRQLHLVNESEVMNMSLTQYDTFLKNNKTSGSRTDADRVRRVGSNLAAAVNRYFAARGQSQYLEGYRWEFNLIENKSINAWCMPGGKVVVYSGILPLIKNDDQLATVMSHEIAHAVARHGSERMSQQLVQQGFGVALSIALAEKPQQTQQLAMMAFGIGSTVGILIPFSRKHEYEADELGLCFMAMAGYNPSESIGFWRMMAQYANSSTPELISTHPLDGKRIARITEKIPEAMSYYHADGAR